MRYLYMLSRDMSMRWNKYKVFPFIHTIKHNKFIKVVIMNTKNYDNIAPSTQFAKQ